MPDLVVTGSVGIDTIETPKDSAPDVLGGSASHFALAASFYTDPGLVAVVGEDFPEEYRSLLQGRGVCFQGLEVDPEGETFRWHGRYRDDTDHRDTVSVNLGVYEDYKPKVPDQYREPRILFLANIGPDVQMSVQDQVGEADLVAADTMDLWITTQRDDVEALLQRVDVLFINEDESVALADERNLVEAGRKLQAMGPETVVLKKGSHGAILLKGDEIFMVPAYPYTKVVDPTGAGDSFAGGFLGYLAREGWDDPDAFRKATVHGTVLGSLNVEGFATKALEAAGGAVLEERYAVLQEITRF